MTIPNGTPSGQPSDPRTAPSYSGDPRSGDRTGDGQSASDSKVWLWASAAVLLAVVATGSFLYARYQREQMDRVVAANQSLNASLTQMQDQLQSVTERLSRRIEESRTAPAPTPAPVPTPVVAHKAVSSRPATPPAPRNDPRVDALQTQLAEQQKALAAAREDADRTRADLGETREELNKTRDDWNGRLDSTRDNLSGSIARNHDQLVALEKRGERSYFEFSLDRSKQFQKVGPLSVSLRKVDFKRKSYDVALLVDDFTLQKKSVNLYEPVWVNLNDRPEPVQLIVNHIDKDKIAGYIAAPRYSKSELAPTATNRTALQPSPASQTPSASPTPAASGTAQQAPTQVLQ
jgi:hypothetical protein